MTFNPSERKIKMKEKTISAWERVVLARKAERPKSLDYINTIFTNGEIRNNGINNSITAKSNPKTATITITG